KAAIRDQRDARTQACAHDRRSRFQHFGHTGSALGPYVADHDHVTFLDFPALHTVDQFEFTIENPGRTLKTVAFLTGNLGNRSFRRQVPVEDLKVASRLYGAIEWPDDILRRKVDSRDIGQIFTKRLARHRQAISVEHAVVEQIFHHQRYATDLVKIFHEVFSAGLEVGQQWRLV